MTTAKAAITNGKGNFSIKNIQVGRPKANEVLVKIKAAGICHTDWDSLTWANRFTWNDYLILGHEGAGTIEAIGENVQHVKVGDAVLLNWAISCNVCFQCLHGNYSICEADKHPSKNAALYQDKPIMRSFNIGTMSTHTIVKKEAVVKIEVPVSFPSAAIVGCGVMTGYGSVVKAAKVEARTSQSVTSKATMTTATAMAMTMAMAMANSATAEAMTATANATAMSSEMKTMW